MIDHDKEEMAARLRGSLIEFTKFFTKYITNRDYIESNPVGRESHQISICRELSSIARMEYPYENLLINVEPGSGKTLHVCMFVAWCYTHNPQCNFIYISYSQTLSATQTAFIKTIMSSEMYGYLFGVQISRETKAKDHFATTEGGHVAAFGAEGAITGRNAGLPGQKMFSGAVIIDDAHKPDEAHSDTIRERVIRNYEETIRQRPRGDNVPIIFIGQRVHEADLAAFFIDGHDIKPWRKVILRSLDAAGNALYPEVHPREYLLELQNKSPYVYAAQFDQNPNPSGGGLFRPEWFLELDDEPTFLHTFITVDSAETAKTYNDPTAMSFFGLYEIEVFGKKTGQLGLHWIDCSEDWIDAAELEEHVMDFWRECSRHKTPPLIAVIEKKSTGVTLSGSLSKLQGIKIRDVQRTSASGSKTARYIEMQPYAVSKCITFTKGARHVENCKKHMSKITANDTHRHDDICHVAGSKIATLYGDKNIEDIKIGEKIITPFGIGLVSNVKMTGVHHVIKKLGLESTPNHKVFTTKGFLRLDSVSDDDKIDKLSLLGLLSWRLKKQLFLMVKNTHAVTRADIIEAVREQQKIKLSTALFSNFIQEKKLQKVSIFTIRMAIDLITILTIWSCYRAANTQKNIMRKLKTCKIMQKFGIKAKKVVNGIKQTQSNLCLKYLLSVKQYVLSVTKNLFIQNLDQLPKLAASLVTQKNINPRSANSHQNALSVTAHSQQRISIPNLETERHARIYAEEIIKKPVYSLTVKKYGVYYCNNILLQNCDTLYDGVKIGLIDKSLHKIEANSNSGNQVMNKIAQNMRRQQQLRMNRDGIR